MTITITRDRSHKMKHTATVRHHAIALDEPVANGGEAWAWARTTCTTARSAPARP
jgi:hypothetical protein